MTGQQRAGFEGGHFPLALEYYAVVVTARAQPLRPKTARNRTHAMSKDDDDERIPVEIDPVAQRPAEPVPLRAEPAAAMPFTQELSLEPGPPDSRPPTATPT